MNYISLKILLSEKPMVSSMDTTTLLMPWETLTEVLDRLFQAPSTGSRAWRGFLTFSSAEEQPELVMRHNSKRPTEYYRCFYHVPSTLSTLSLLEIKLLWTVLASGKGAQLLWSCSQQYVLYPSQASEYSRAARFAQHSQHIHDGWRRAIPTLHLAAQHTCDLDTNPAAPTEQQLCRDRLSPGRGTRTLPSTLLSATLQGHLWIEPQRPAALPTAAGSTPEGWKLSQDMNHTQPRCPPPRGLVASKLSKIYFAQRDTWSPGRLKKQKPSIKKTWEPSLSSLCSISNKTSHRTAAANISDAVFPVFSLKASDLSRALPMVPKC